MRILLLGNAGSGKTTLARRLVGERGIAHLSLDEFAWGAGSERRALDGSLRDLHRFLAAHDSWVVEGCYGDLVEAALPHCTELRWLDPGLETCLEHCRRRPFEPEKFPSAEAQDALLEPLLEWVNAYSERDDEFGLRRHRRIFESFAGPKRRYTNVASYGVPPSRRPPIQTERLLLRDLGVDDAPLLLELDSDPEVMRHIGVAPAPELDAYRERARSVYMPWQAHPWHGLWLVESRSSAEFLGWVLVRPANAHVFAADLGWNRPDEIEVGYRLRRAAWGQGIATEAAAPLVRRALADPATSAVVACALRANGASLRVLEKLGLERVGEVRLPVGDGPAVKLARPR